MNQINLGQFPTTKIRMDNPYMEKRGYEQPYQLASNITDPSLKQHYSDDPISEW